MRFVAVLLISASAAQAGDLPDLKLTPGVADPLMTAAKLCSKSFHTGSVRNVPESEKKQVYAEYGVKCVSGKASGSAVSCSTMEVDHLISLELGGVNNIKNLWPQSYLTMPWNAHVKDKLENKLHALVCDGTVTLGDAQSEISTDWIAAYKRWVKP